VANTHVVTPVLVGSICFVCKLRRTRLSGYFIYERQLFPFIKRRLHYTEVIFITTHSLTQPPMIGEPFSNRGWVDRHLAGGGGVERRV
jgi:hypothetical protein